MTKGVYLGCNLQIKFPVDTVQKVSQVTYFFGNQHKDGSHDGEKTKKKPNSMMLLPNIYPDKSANSVYFSQKIHYKLLRKRYTLTALQNFTSDFHISDMSSLYSYSLLHIDNP